MRTHTQQKHSDVRKRSNKKPRSQDQKLLLFGILSHLGILRGCFRPIVDTYSRGFCIVLEIKELSRIMLWAGVTYKSQFRGEIVKENFCASVVRVCVCVCECTCGCMCMCVCMYVSRALTYTHTPNMHTKNAPIERNCTSPQAALSLSLAPKKRLRVYACWFPDPPLF